MLKAATMAVVVLGAMALVSCQKRGPVDFEPVRSDFVYGSLALSPVSATQAGYHYYKQLPLDEMLDDYSQAGVQGQRMSGKAFAIVWRRSTRTR